MKPLQTAPRAPKLQPLRSPIALSSLGYGLVITWATLGAIATTVNLGTVQWMEHRAQTLFFRLRGTTPPPENVVILEMDQSSLDRGKDYLADPQSNPDFEPLQTYPWKRSAYARVIERLMQAGAKAVAVDVIFVDPRQDDPAGDAELGRVLVKYGDRVVLASQYETFGNPDSGEMGQLVVPNPQFQAEPPYHLINFLPEPDQSVSQLPENFIQQVLQPLGLAQDTHSFALAALKAAQFSSPEKTTGHIYFYGRPTTFPRIPFWHLLSPENWAYHQQQQTFAGKVVLIGPVAESFQDFVATPFSERMPGIELHANTLATLMENRVIQDALPNPLGRAGAVGLGTMAIATFLIYRFKRPVPLFLGFLGVAIAWGGISYFSLMYGYTILPVAVPFTILLLSGLSNLTTGSIADQLEKRRLRHTLERYVAAPIVREILTNSDDFQSLLKGRRVRAAVLFCDIRGFTNFSLETEPEQLVEQLNTYLNAMVEVILEAGGTVDKFIGDAIMAEFGSPISQGEEADALNAIHAALAMRKALLALQDEWAARGQAVLFNGVGINFGEAIAGDIGSARRREYALIGDAVNVASRVEGLTRKLITDILITESLYEKVQDAVEVVPVGAHEMKGRGQNKVMLYSLVGLKGTSSEPYRQMHRKLHQHHGLNLKES
ncbi:MULTISPECIES: adenylate/guanylate cyclase domain-containing protein [unclassified Leptolyngbya]|uniref:CHASE2 domain-containing protein n=1 Tax=unclassified Leptolyngbya TaxID=2650499 RepID=UPI0016846845|nr:MULTISPECIES: adenylate/guanylate cyclase domain-containing protein [unclassified Leptolyngbya]MBD1909700.1 adenylate/guanylate cyclase domain-containing protein [Leptolyngbya sp. FACHB-8]MBD2155966.1 adenylate/guanylate cyclase domain-containing protein [Leptolyngbya sp. FACHB-16]